MRVIIIGPMASGKSVVGKKLSKKLKMSFYDTDKEIEEAAGASISWIFDVEGEKKFRDREYQILSKVMEMENCVISTGGGIILEEKNRKLLEKGTVVYLQTSIQSQLERTMNDKERPLLQGNINKEETLRKIASERNPVYEALTDITIQETNTPDESVNAIIKELNL